MPKGARAAVPGVARRFSSATRIAMWTALLVVVAVALLVYGLGRWDAVGGKIERARRAETAERALRDLRETHTQIYSAFARIDAEDDAAARTSSLARALAPSQALPDLWNVYRKGSIRLPGEAAIVARYDQANRAYSSIAQRAGARLVSADIAAPEVRRLLDDVATAEGRVMRALNQLVTLYERHVTDELHAAAERTTRSQRNLLWLTLSSLAFLVLLLAISARFAHRRDSAFRRLERDREEAARRTEFEAQLQRALAMSTNEDAVYAVVARAFREVVGERPVQMLVADGPHDDFEPVVTTVPGAPACPVVSPHECVAARLGQTFEVASSATIDACPYLPRDDESRCSAVCVPVVVADRPLGVVHLRGAEHDALDRSAGALLRLVARRTGEKIGGLRAFARSQAQAATDPLTGLANRRTLEHVAREHVGTGEPYAIAYGDLDHFKRLNDTNGHEIGDRALRVFARVLDAVTRPGDVAVRYGGEEFVLFLADCDAHMAVTIAERVRESLRDELSRAAVPAFTVSFGIATSEDRDSFDGVLRAADEMLLAAKADGRDCVRVTPAPGASPDRGALAA